MYDCIVIGAGIVGSSAAYHLSRKGKHTLLLEQFPLPHTRGSSHGCTRVYRSSYANPIYARMAVESLNDWRQLERETNTPLYRKAGMLLFDKPPYKYLSKSIKTNEALGVDFQIFSPQELHERFPGLAKMSEDSKAFLETTAGVLKADKALECFRTQIKKFGGEIRDSEKVESIIPGETIIVRTDQGNYRTRALIITPGAWICKLMEPLGLKLPLQVVRTTVGFWKENIPGQTKGYPMTCDFTIDIPRNFREPCFIYSFPSDEYPGLRKIGIHQGIETDPDVRDECEGTDTSDIDFLYNYVKTNYPQYGQTPSIVEYCMYTLTPDEDYIIDTLPHHPNIAFGCGFSGHGFKVAPVIGRVLGEMAMRDKVSYDLSTFSLKRFPGTSVSAKY